MPRGVSTPWKVDPVTGAVLPYYEGSFNVRGDLGNNSLGIDSEQVSAGQRTIDLYQPERLIFKRQALGDAGGTTAPGDEVGAIWAQYPDPLAIPADMNADAAYSRVMVAAGAPGIGGRRGAFRKLLGSDGTSDYLQSANTLVPVFKQLARVGANTISSPGGGTGGMEVCRWSATIPIGGTGMYGAMISGQGSSDTAGGKILTILINEVVAGYMEHAFVAADTSQYRTFTTSLAAYTTQRLAAGVTYLVRVVTYATGYSPYTDGNNIYQGLMYRWAL